MSSSFNLLKFIRLVVLPVILFVNASCSPIESAEKKQNSVTQFMIVSSSTQQTVFIDRKADPLIKWAATAFIDDIQALSGTQLKLELTHRADKPGIYVGQIGSELMSVQGLLATETQTELNNAWETFAVQKQADKLVVAGSDIRGTVYGLFELSERLGISPWRWWADVAPELQSEVVLELEDGGFQSGPSVQYRGIFLNDEDWGLQPWAEHTFETEVGDMGPKTYEKIFQLLLRLKANTIWPAMHPSTQAFYMIDGNQQMAQKYHIVIGTSHAEPMLRNNVDEWDRNAFGDYNYFTNSEKINEYWQGRINQVNNENDQFIATLGMRGVHDSHMEGSESIEDSIKILDDIINTQRNMLETTLGKPAESIPQTFIPYKEVLELYNNGLTVPDDVTLMWTDDNYGYIRRLSDKQEQARSGGSGVYYHLSYWGRPHDYLWLSSTQPGLIWFEMKRAYDNGAKKIWIANVGDIKPAEYNMEFFLDLAWDIDSIQADTIDVHMQTWAQREFGKAVSEPLAEVMSEYYRLAFLRKPEFMGWSQTEPTRPTKLTEFSKSEANNRLAAYQSLVTKVDKLAETLPDNKRDAWFQLVAYPVKGAALMNEKFIYRQFAVNANKPVEEAKYRALSTAAYQQIQTLTLNYNEHMAKGKWKHMMSAKPRNLPVFKAPGFDLEPKQMSQPQAGNLYIQAADFNKSSGRNGFSWHRIEGLGYSNQAVTLLPLENVYFEQQQPWLEYQVTVPTSGQYLLEFRFLPTHANQFDHQASVWVNGQPIKTLSLNTKGRSEQWKINTLRNSQIMQLAVELEAEQPQTIRLSVNQTGIVLDQLAIYPADAKPTYEIPLKQ